MDYKVIDVSEWQEKIDWKKAWKSKEFSAVILRCGYGSNEYSKDDKQWTRNVTECERLGIPYGVYLYSYATPKTIYSEIEHVLRLLKGHSPTLPVYLDLEESKYGKYFLDNAVKFCKEITKAGYKAGVYSGSYLFKQYLTSLNKNYSRWIAAYGKNKNGKVYPEVKPNVGEDAWQYTSTGKVSGINGNVDVSIFYTDYLSVDNKDDNKTDDNKNKTDNKVGEKMSVTPITDFSKYTNKVSNSGGDENGGIRNGKAGDQTGKEWWIRGWYDFKQNYIIRFNERKIANTFATLSIYAAENNKVGYDQYQRTSYNTQLKKVGNDPRKITVACEDDCSAGVLANLRATLELLGYKEEAKKINTSGTTWDIVSIVKKTGLNVTIFTDSLHCRSNKYQLPGDINLNDGRHVNVNLGVGSMMSKSAVTGEIKKEETKKTTKKECVKQLQTALNTSYNLKLKVDGDFGKNTKKAVDAHYLYYRPRTIQNQHVKWLQQMLSNLGYIIDIDGSYGNQSKTVVMDFQKKHGLDVDGYAGVKTHEKIISLFK